MRTYAQIYEFTDYDGVTEDSGFSVITDGKNHKIAFPIDTSEEIINSLVDALSARFNAIEINNKEATADVFLDMASYNMLVTSKTNEDDEYENFDTFEEALDYVKSFYLADLDLDEDSTTYPFVFYSPVLFDKNGEKQEKSITASATEECPPATQDIAINLANREKAIKTAAYGPLNPKEPNDEFWAEKSQRWSVKPEEAKKSLCGNCVMFIRTSKMLDCIASGLESGDSGKKNAWDAIDTAELGYCEAFDFKCAASRTCNAWVVGGPIDDTKEGA